MSFIFNIRVSLDSETVHVVVYRNGDSHKFKLNSSTFIALFESDNLYDQIAEWFGGPESVPDLDSDVYDNIVNVYTYLKNPVLNVPAQKKSIVRKLIGGLLRPSIVPQALIPHRVSPFADSEKVWTAWIETKPFIEKARQEESRLQTLQATHEKKFLESSESKKFNSNFEALMAYRGVSRAQVKRSFFTNLVLALSFFLLGFIQLYYFTRLIFGMDTSILSLPFIGIYSYLAWPLSILVIVYSFSIAFVRLWFCVLINKRKLETEFSFMEFIKSRKYFPGDFKDFEV